MKSAVPKVLHPVGGLPMLAHVLAAAKGAGADEIAVVVGPEAGAVAAFVRGQVPDATLHEQRDRLGTAHAVLAAKAALATRPDEAVIIYGDTPLVRAATLKRLRRALAAGADMVVAGFRPLDPTGYGRLIMDGRQLVRIVEEKDASREEKLIGLVNAGIMAFRGDVLLATLKKIGNANAKGEYYLTDAAAVAARAGRTVKVIEVDADEVIGVNSRAELAHAEGLFQRRAREAAMAAGVTMIAPSTVWFSHDTKLGRDVTLEPNVFFGPGVTVADNVTIRANSHIEGATVASGAIIGPFARLRPGAVLGQGVHIGNFVEVKNATLGDRVKANHLAYIGDAHIGAETNYGAGAITANYDGFDKHRTEIGANVAIGSNVVLRAPVTIGDGASIGAGSVVARDVPADALALTRGEHVEKPGWAKKYRDRKRAAAAKPR